MSIPYHIDHPAGKGRFHLLFFMNIPLGWAFVNIYGPALPKRLECIGTALIIGLHMTFSQTNPSIKVFLCTHAVGEWGKKFS